MQNEHQTVGIDGCKGGWVAICTLDNNFGNATGFFLEKFSDIRNYVSKSAVIIVDMPIGLEKSKATRLCDKLGREYLGSRSSSLFSPPCIEALYEPSYELAKEQNKKFTGNAISKQSWNLREKIIEVRTAIADGIIAREGHPECSFATLKGSVLKNNKKSLRGMLERFAFLTKIGFNPTKIVEGMSETAEVKIDDLLDAMVLCWTADRVKRNKHFTFPPGERNINNIFDCKIFV